MPLREKKGIERAKAIMKYCDSESNELMIGVLHMAILPAMFELGRPWAVLQVAAHLAGAFRSSVRCGTVGCSCVRLWCRSHASSPSPP